MHRLDPPSTGETSATAVLAGLGRAADATPGSPAALTRAVGWGPAPLPDVVQPARVR